MSQSAWEVELTELISIARESTLDDDARARLQRLVIENREACRHYIRQMHLAATLQWSFGIEGNNTASIGLPSHGAPAGPRTANSKSPDVLQQKSMPLLGFLHRGAAALQRPVFFSIMAVAVAFYGSFAILSWNLRTDVVSRQSQVTAATVAVVSATEDVRWSTNVANRESDFVIRKNELLAIESGIVETQLKRGTTLLIQGPAKWSIDDENHATLHSGTLLATVPSQAIGFTLQTPSAQIVDLGTEFGVSAHHRTGTELSVVKGLIEVRFPEAGRDPLRIGAGQARRIAAPSTAQASAVEVIPYQEMQIGSKLHKQSPLTRWRTACARLQQDGTLIARYDFEGREQRLRNTLADQLHGTVIERSGNAARPQGRWFGKGALAFGEHFSTASIPHHPKLDLGEEWTIACWLRLDAPSSSIVQILGKGQEPRRQYSLWLLPDRGGSLHCSCYGVSGTNYHVDASAPLEPHRWSLVVCTRSRNELRMYLNGVEAGTAVAILEPLATSSDPLVMGYSLEPIYPGLFTGAMDELFLAHRAFNAQEIEQLYQAGRPE